MANHLKYFGLILPLCLLGSCGGTLGGNPEKTGSGVKFSITDAPVDDMQHVFVTVRSVAIKGEGEDWVEVPLEASEEFDLLSLQQGRSRALAALEGLSEGVYTETRLQLEEGTGARLIDKEGEEFFAKVPSGSESGLKIKSPFTVSEGATTELTIDFDLRKSLKAVGNGEAGRYQLLPVLRLVEDQATGSIRGVAPEGALICFYEGAPVEDATCENAVSTAKVENGTFHAAYLPASRYSLLVYQGSEAVAVREGIEVKAQEATEVGTLP